MLHPIFPADQFAKVQRQSLSALDAEKQEPAQLAGKLTGKVMYGAHPYGAYLTPETVKAITRDDLVAFHQDAFLPNNATLAIVGDVKADGDPAADREGVRRLAKGDVPQLKLPALPKIAGLTVHLVDRPGSVQSNIVIAQPGPPRNNPDLPELNVLNATLGGGFSGRLFQNLREKHGWTYGAYSRLRLQEARRRLRGHAETRNEVTAPGDRRDAEGNRSASATSPCPRKSSRSSGSTTSATICSASKTAAASRSACRTSTSTVCPPISTRPTPAAWARRRPRKCRNWRRNICTTENLAIVVVGEAKEIKPELEKIGKVVRLRSRI